MSDWRVLSVDGGVTTYFRFKDGQYQYKTSEDVESLLNATQRARNNDSGNWRGDMHHYASIPIVLWMEWSKELKAMGCSPNPGAKENEKYLKRKLNDPEFQKLRTKMGRV